MSGWVGGWVSEWFETLISGGGYFRLDKNKL
jgi:hypothetical protein